jgi:hypothetical protein
MAIGSSALLALGHKPVDHLYDFLRASPYADVLGQVHPPDCAGCIHQKFGRPRDVTIVLAGAGVQNTVTANEVGVGIGKKSKGIAFASGKLPRFRRRIDADGGDCDSALTKFLQVLLETP